MPKITFLLPNGEQKDIDVAENTSIMETALEHDIPGIVGLCGGCVSCATCHVYVHPDWEDKVIAANNDKCDDEEDLLDTIPEVEHSSRLGCQVKLTNALDGLIVALPGTDTGW